MLGVADEGAFADDGVEGAVGYEGVQGSAGGALGDAEFDGQAGLSWDGHIRVRDHTCSCRFPTYELCTAAGLSFVRRTINDNTIMESPWLPSRDTQELWQRILRGQAW